MLFLDSVPATIPIAGLPLICSLARFHKRTVEGTTGRYNSSKTVVFLESGNDNCMRQSTAKRNLSETSFGMIEPQKSSEPDNSSLGNKATGTESSIGMPTVSDTDCS